MRKGTGEQRAACPCANRPFRGRSGGENTLTALFLPSRSVPDAQNDDAVSIHAVTQNIRPHGRHLSLSIASVAAPIGEFGETVGQRDQPFAEPLRGGGIEDRDIGYDRFELTDRLVGPDDPVQFSRRRVGAARVSRSPRIAASALPPNG